MINSRTKGKVFERTVANMLKTWPGLGDARRGLTQSSGAIEPDVTATNWPFWTECKHGRHVNVRAALFQAWRDMHAAAVREHGPRLNPAALILNLKPTVVIARDTGGDIFFAMPWTYNARQRVLTSLNARHVFVAEPSAPTLVFTGGSVCCLTPGATWRNFRQQLAPLGDRDLLIVEGEVAVGWVETLGFLWASRK